VISKLGYLSFIVYAKQMIRMDKADRIKDKKNEQNNRNWKRKDTKAVDE
jgi:hypothetical protein